MIYVVGTELRLGQQTLSDLDVSSWATHKDIP